MEDRFNFRIPEFTDKDKFIGFQHIELGDSIDELIAGRLGEPQQCTGLKDKNGKLIYEGDIIKVPDDYDEFGMMACEIREVWHKDGGFRLRPKDEFQLKKGARGHWLEDDNTFEIIGNIWENPETLKGEKNEG